MYPSSMCSQMCTHKCVLINVCSQMCTHKICAHKICANRCANKVCTIKVCSNIICANNKIRAYKTCASKVDTHKS